MSRHSFASKFLKEISIFLFEPPRVKTSLIFFYLRSVYSLVTLEEFDLITTELIKSINTCLPWHVKGNVAKCYHATATIKLYILTNSIYLNVVFFACTIES